VAEGIDELFRYRTRGHNVRMRMESWENQKMSSEDNEANGRGDEEEDEDEEQQEEETEDESEEHVSEKITEREEDSEHGKEKRPKRAKTIG
jgi:hypothetical protein